ncbi:MAG: hypothetical protein JXB49_05835 [Bacteroidales bacterium]|nr:hypothetical protein [Bacteroidales bacterium]
MINSLRKIVFKPEKTRAKPAFFIFSGLLVIIIGLVYGSNFSPALYYDDFKVFAYRFFTNNLPWFIHGFVRPLSYATFRLETELFGMNLSAHIVFRIGLLIIQGLLLFVLLEKLRIFPSLLNFICSLLILLSPIDMSRMWLSVEPMRFVFVLIYMIGLVVYIEKKNISALIIGLVFGFTLLFNYEAQLGLILLFPVYLFFRHRIMENRNSYILLIPFVLGILYLLFRVFGPLFGVTDFHSSQTITLIYLLRQFRNGLVCHVTGWILPVISDEKIRMMTVFTSVFSLLFYLVHALKYGFEKFNKRSIKRAFSLCAIGFVFWLAGYFPWIAYGIPSYMNWFSSRAHNFAIPGAVLVLIGIIDFLGEMINVNNNRKQIISTFLSLPFLVIGAMSQVAIQKETKILWNDYKTMWNGIFEVVPNIKENPHVVLVISPYNPDLRFGERDFFTSASYNSEVSLALAMFYANDKLEGEFMYKNLEVRNTPILNENGIKNPPTYSGAIPYSDILFIEYDRINQKVDVVRDIEKEFGIIDPSYNADKYIDSNLPSGKTLRYIFSYENEKECPSSY